MGLTVINLAAFIDKREAVVRNAERGKQKIERQERLRDRDKRMKEGICTK